MHINKRIDKYDTIDIHSPRLIAEPYIVKWIIVQQPDTKFYTIHLAIHNFCHNQGWLPGWLACD